MYTNTQGILDYRAGAVWCLCTDKKGTAVHNDFIHHIDVDESEIVSIKHKTDVIHVPAGADHPGKVTPGLRYTEYTVQKGKGGGKK